MRRSTGAIFLETRPDTIITSACLGEARKTSEPKRARSFREEVAFIISIAQHAKPKVAGHSDDLRAQLISESSRVVKTSGKTSAIMFSSPITIELLPNQETFDPKLTQLRHAALALVARFSVVSTSRAP